MLRLDRDTLKDLQRAHKRMRKREMDNFSVKVSMHMYWYTYVVHIYLAYTAYRLCTYMHYQSISDLPMSVLILRFKSFKIKVKKWRYTHMNKIIVTTYIHMYICIQAIKNTSIYA